MYRKIKTVVKLSFSEQTVSVLIIDRLHWLLRRQRLLLIGPELRTSSGREREARCTSTGGEKEKESGAIRTKSVHEKTNQQ